MDERIDGKINNRKINGWMNELMTEFRILRLKDCVDRHADECMVRYMIRCMIRCMVRCMV